MNSTLPRVPLASLMSPVETWSSARETRPSIDYVDIGSIDREKKQISETTRIAPQDAPSRAKYIVRTGDILVSTVRPNLNAVAVVSPSLSGAVASSGFTVLRADESKAVTSFIFHWVRTQFFIDEMVRQATGASYPAVSNAIVGSSDIPLPIVQEQRRISAMLDKADAIRRKRQEAIALTEQLLRSTFLEMFGSVSERISLEKICTRVTDGTHQPPKWVPLGIPFIFVSNIEDHGISFETKKFISEETWAELTARCPIEVNDILYTTVGSYGNAAIVKAGTPRFAFQRHIAHIKPDAGLVDPYYLLAALQSPDVRRQADEQARGVAQKTLNLAQLKKFEIPYPPRAHQERYAKLRSTITDHLTKQVEARRLSDNLFNSLVQRAFSGQL